MDKMENEEIEFETYNDEEEQSISVSGGMEYTPLKVEDLPRSEQENKVIQKKIYYHIIRQELDKAKSYIVNLEVFLHDWF